MQGAAKDEIPPTGVWLFVDVREVALAHVKAAEVEAAGGNRFFVVAGKFNNKQLGAVLRKGLPDLADKLPTEKTPGGEFPEGGLYDIDNSKSKEILGLKYRSFDESALDTAKSLQSIKA